MAGRWIPEEYWDAALPGLRSLFEHTAAVQVCVRVFCVCVAVGYPPT